jgi:hypothetical protein
MTPTIDINEKKEKKRPEGNSCFKAWYRYQGMTLLLVDPSPKEKRKIQQPNKKQNL